MRRYFQLRKLTALALKSHKIMATTSQETESIKMPEGRFSEEHFTPILSSDEEEYDDYTEKDWKNFPSWILRMNS